MSTKKSKLGPRTYSAPCVGTPDRLKLVESWLADRESPLPDTVRRQLENERSALAAGLVLVSPKVNGVPSAYEVLLTSGRLIDGALDPPTGLPDTLGELYRETAGALVTARILYDSIALRGGVNNEVNQELLVQTLTWLRQARARYRPFEVAFDHAAGQRPSAFAEALDWTARLVHVALFATDNLWEVPHLDLSDLLARLRRQVIGAARFVDGADSEEPNSDSRAAANERGDGEGRPANPIDADGIWNELMTSPPLPASTIAQKLGQPLSKIERVLRYQRKVQPFCFIPDDGPGRGLTKYLHKMPDVLPALKKWYEKQVAKRSE